MTVQTVTGSIDPEQLGITLPHEHVLFDLTTYFVMPDEGPRKELAISPVVMANLGELRRDAFACRDNLVNHDQTLAVKELEYYKRAGGKSLVDVTSVGIGRDPLALRSISIRTGINIICGCGFYLDKTHPERVKAGTVDEIAGEIVEDLTTGIGETGVRAGIIGELGTDWPISQNEEKVLRAAAKAHLRTNAPICIHPYPYGKFAHRILDILQGENVPLSRIVLAHIDAYGGGFDVEYHKSLAERGAVVEYDTFGSEIYYDGSGVYESRDTERIQGIIQMIEAGYVKQLLLSHDICHKIHLKEYGGYGFAHLLTHIVPILRKNGVTQAHLDQMMIENPRRTLDI